MPVSKWHRRAAILVTFACAANHAVTVDGLLKNTLETLWWLNIIYSAEGDF